MSDRNERIARLSAADIPACMRLKEAAGWNQTEEDWRRLLRLAPESCWGLFVDGIAAATTTAVVYESGLAWIGMVLTLPEYRGRGYATRLLETALGYLEGRATAVGLDATEMGAPLYRKLGFVDGPTLARWIRPPSSKLIEVTLEPSGGWGYDQWLLAELNESSAQHGSSFAMTRSGSHSRYFGPAVGSDLEPLVQWAIAEHGDSQMVWDVFDSDSEASTIAAMNGFSRSRGVIRMGLHTPPSPTGNVRAICGFEWG